MKVKLILKKSVINSWTTWTWVIAVEKSNLQRVGQLGLGSSVCLCMMR